MSDRRPVVAVSSCLLGEKVRYDGGDKRNAIILDVLTEYFELLPFCPEVGIGLPVPRPPIQLVQGDGAIHVLGVENPEIEVGERLHEYGRNMADRWHELSGFIFKSRSPSCGLASVPLHTANGEVIGTVSGAFAEEIAHAFPELPMVEEEAMVDPLLREQFIHQVLACHR